MNKKLSTIPDVSVGIPCRLTPRRDIYQQSAINSGFTLVELLVTVTIIALITVSSGQIFSFILRNSQKAKAVMTTKQTGDQALSVLANQIRSASSITSTCNSVAGSTISFTTSFETTTVIECTSTKITINSSDLVDGVSDDLVIVNPNLCFTCFPGNGLGPDIVQISYTLKKGGTDPISSAQLLFSTSVSLRNY